MRTVSYCVVSNGYVWPGIYSRVVYVYHARCAAQKNGYVTETTQWMAMECVSCRFAFTKMHMKYNDVYKWARIQCAHLLFWNEFATNQIGRIWLDLWCFHLQSGQSATHCMWNENCEISDSECASTKTTKRQKHFRMKASIVLLNEREEKKRVCVSV